MNQSAKETEKIVTKKFRDSLNVRTLSIRVQQKWKTPLLIRTFDILIYKSQHPYAVIEIKSSLKNKNILARATDQVRSAISITNARFGVVTDNLSYFIYDRNERDQDFQKVPYQKVITTLLNPVKITFDKQDLARISQIILKSAMSHLAENQGFVKFITEKNITTRLEFDESSNTFKFKDSEAKLTSFENQFFISMLGTFEEKKICRYTSFKTAFDMLNHISLRMSGLVGMNDRSEINYVDKYLNDVEKPIDEMHYNSVIALNNRYITSCTGIERKDDLTLWRLYAEDAKGVCLVFDVRKTNHSNKVLLQKVKYADETGTHVELEFLKQIRQDVENLTGFSFEFRTLSYWKHFFKSFDYSVEEEVRLLIIDDGTLQKIKSDWVMTSTHSIINPIIDFRLNQSSFPIHLTEIILGPKCPEQIANAVQFEELIRRQKREIKAKKYDSNLNNLNVRQSKIKHYR